MTVNTGINSSLLKPQTFHVLTFLRGSRALEPIPQRICLIGPMGDAGTATAGEVIELSDPTENGTLFVQGSVMHLMAAKAFETIAYLGQGPRVYACPLADTTTKRAMTITITGTATDDKDLIMKIAGRPVVVGVASGTVQNGIASALDSKIDELAEILPVTSAVAANVVTITDVTAGTLGADIMVDVVQKPTGVTVAVLETVAGAGALDISTALDAVAGQDFDALALATHHTATLTPVATHIASTWSASEKKPRWIVLGETGSIGTATTLASTANHEGVLVLNWEQSRSLPYEIAAAGAVLLCSKNRPNANYDGAKLPLYPPPIAYAYTNTEIESALNAGVTPLSPVVDPTAKTVVDGVGKVERLITTRTTRNSIPFSLLRDVGVSRTAWAMAKQYDIAFEQRFGSEAQPDGPLLTDETMEQIRDMVIGINYAAEESQWIRNVDDDKAKLVVERDSTAIGRVNLDVAYTIVVGLHQAAYVHRAQL